MINATILLNHKNVYDKWKMPDTKTVLHCCEDYLSSDISDICASGSTKLSAMQMLGLVLLFLLC